MKNIESFVSSLYVKFKNEFDENKCDVVRDVFNKENDIELCKEYANPSYYDFGRELTLFLADALETDGQKEKAEWLRSEAEKMKDANEAKIAFYWLDNRVETEVQMMQKPKRKHLSQTISQIVENPELLNGNHSNVGFVIKGEESLRDIKKEGSGGYRCFFTLLLDGKSCVIIGVSSGKSTTDVPQSENDHFLELSKQVQSNFDVTNAEKVEIITESMVGICVLEQPGTRAIVESIDFPDNSILVTNHKHGKNSNFVVFFKKGLTQESLLEKLKGVPEEEMQKAIVNLIFGNLISGIKIEDQNDFNFCGYIIKD